MPDLKNSYSPLSYSGNVVPDYNFGDRSIKPAGSMDTWLNTLTGTNYDKGFNPYKNQNDLRYENQNWAAYLGNNLAALGAKTLNGVVQAVGGITSMIASPLAMSNSVTFDDVFSKNPINRLASGIDEHINELFPRVQKSDFDSLSFMQQLGRPGELISENLDSLAFMASSFATAGLLGKLNLGTKLASKLQKARPAYQYLSKVEGPNGAGLADKINFFISNEALTFNESAQEAEDARTTLRQTLQQKRDLGEVNLTDAQIEDKVNMAGINTFWLNAMTLSVTNSVFTNMMSPLWKQASNKANPYALKFLNGKFQAPVYSNMFERYLTDKGFAPGLLAKDVIGNVISEGMEESLQYSIQNINSTDGISFGDAYSRYISDMKTGEVLNLSDKERAKAFGLGSLIGSLGPLGATGLGAAGIGVRTDEAGNKSGGWGAVGEAREYREGQGKAIGELNDSYANFTSLSRFKDKTGKLFTSEGKYINELDGKTNEITKEEFVAAAKEKGLDELKGGDYSVKGELSIDENGNPNISPKALAELVKDTKKHGELMDLIEKEVSTPNPDETKLRLYKLESLATAAKASHSAGVMDIFEDQLDTLSKDSIVGLNSTLPVEQEISLAKDYVGRLRTAFDTVDNSLIKPVAKSVAKEKVARLIALDYVGQTQEAKISQLEEGMNENEVAYARKLALQLKKNDSVEKAFFENKFKKGESKADVFEQYNTDELENASKKVQDHARAAVNMDYIIQAREELGRTVDKILAGKQEDITTPFEKNSIPFRPPTSAKEYKFYEDRISKKFKYDNNVNDILDQYNSSLYAELEKYLSLQDPIEGATQLSNYVTSVIERGIALPSDVKETITNKVDSLKDTVAELEFTVNKGIEADGLSPLEIRPDNAEVLIEDQDVLKGYEQLQALKAAIKPLENFSADKLPLAVKHTVSPKYILGRLQAPAEDLVTKAYDADGKIKPEFSDEAGIEVEIEKLQAIVDNVLPSRPDLKGLKTKALVKQLKKLKSDFEALKKDREVKNIRQEALYAGFVVDAVLNTPLVDTLSPEDKITITGLKDEDSTTASLIAADRVDDLEKIKLEQAKLNAALSNYLKVDLGLSYVNGLIDMMSHNPIRGITGIIEKLNSSNAKKGESVEAFTNFALDYDVVAMMDANIDDRFKPLRNLFGKYYGLWELSLTQNSDLTTRQNLVNYRKFLNGTTVTPTGSQFRTASQVARLVTSTKESVGGRVQAYQNVIFLKAPAGAGKTSVVLPLTIQLTGINKDHVYTCAPFGPGAEAIANSTKTTAHTVNDLVNALNDNKLPEDIKMIVVDEAATLSYGNLHALAGAFAGFMNNNQERNIKLVAMYDPLQTNTSQTGKPVIERVFHSTGVEYSKASPESKRMMEEGKTDPSGTLPFIQNAVDVSPLATTFRSNVGSIIDLQNAFKSDDPISNVATSASTDPNNTTTGILGTYSGPSVDILKVLKSSLISNTGSQTRSRTIITDDVAGWQTTINTQGLVGVEVLSVDQSSGITRDEVYVDLKTENTPSFNRKMYTALSRASKFIFLGNYPTLFVEDASIVEKAKVAEALNQGRNDATKAIVEAQLKYFEDGTETTTQKKEEPVVKKPVTEEEKEEEESETQKEEEAPILEIEDEPFIQIPVVPPIRVETGEGAHSLNFPSHTAFNTYGDGSIPPIKAGDKVHIVRDKSSGKNRYLVLQPLGDTYRTVAIIADNEVAQAEASLFGPNSTAKLSDLVPHVFLEDVTKDATGNNTFMYTPGRQEVQDRYELQIAEGTADLTFHYGYQETELNSQTAATLLLNTLNKLYPNFKGIANTGEIQADPNKFIKYRIFQKEEEAKEELQRTDVTGLIDIPLMIIDGVKLEGAAKTTRLKPLYIRANSAVLHKDNTRSVDLAPMFEFIDTLKKLEDLIPTQVWPSAIYSKFSSSFFYRLNSDNIYFPFHKFIRELAGKEIAVIATDELNDKLKDGEKFLPIDTKTINPKIIEYAKKIDDLIHGGGIYRGGAQKAMDKIAGANFIAQLPNGQTKILRDYRLDIETEGKGAKKITRKVEKLSAASLLGPVTFAQKNGKSKNPLMPKQLVLKIESYLMKAYEKYAKVTNTPTSKLPFLVNESGMRSRYKQLADLLINQKTTHLTPLSSADLTDLFINGLDENNNYTKVNEGFGLRSPLSRLAFSAQFKGSTVPDGMLNTTLENVTPTRIGITFDAASIPSIEVVTSKKGDNKYSAFYAAIENAKDLEEARALTASMEGDIEFNVPFKDAVAIAFDAVRMTPDYVTKSTEARALLKIVRDGKETVKDRMVEILRTSKDATKYGGYAARDYTRAAIYAEVMPELYNTDPNRIMRLASKWIEVDSQEMAHFLEPFADKVMKVQSTFEEIFRELNIPFTPSTIPVLAIEAVVKSSTEYRLAQKQGVDLSVKSDQEVSDYVVWLSKLKEAAQDDATLSVFIDNSEADFLEEFKRVTDIEDEYNADQIIYHLETAIAEASLERSMRKTDSDDIGDLLDEEGAISTYKSFFNVPTLKTLFKRKGTEAFQIIRASYMQYQLGKEMVNEQGETVAANWGLFKDAIVYVVKDSNNKVGSKVIRHEAFHKVVWNYLTSAERAELFDMAAKKYGEQYTQLELEEKLATDFANYMQSKGGFGEWAKRLYNKIKRFFNFSYNNLASLEAFFNSINEGYYSNISGNEVRGIERDLKIAKYWPSVDLFSKAKTIFLDTFIELQRQSRESDGPFRTFDSTIEDTFDIVRQYQRGEIDLGFGEDQEFVRAALTPLVTKPAAYRDFIDTYFSNANAKKAKAEAQAGISEEKRITQEEKADLQRELALLDQSSEEYKLGAIALEELEEREKDLLAEETFESELRDPEEKLTGMIKARLIGLKYTDKGKTFYAPLSKSYNTIISLVEQADASSLQSLLESIKSRLSYFSDSTGKIVEGNTTVRKAAAKFMTELIQRIENSEAPGNLTFFKDVSSPNEYAIFAKDGSSTANVTYTKALLEKDKYTKIERLNGESASVFGQKLQDETGMSLLEIKQAYGFFEDINFIRSLTAAAVSMVKARPFIGSSKWDIYNWTNRYSETGSTGQKAAIESRFVDRFVSYTEKSGTPFTPELTDAIKSAATLKQKRQVFQSLFGKLRLGMVSEELTAEQINSAYDKLKVAYNGINSDLELGNNPYDVIDDQGTLISAVVELFENSASTIENTSYLRGDRKKAYLYRDASFQSMVLNFIDKNLGKKKTRTTVPNHIKVENGELTTTSPFLRLNPFFTGKNKVVSFIDHDSMKKLGNDGQATYLHSETVSDYHKRNFQFGFLNRLRSSRAQTYYQFLPIPANRTTIQAAEVGIVGDMAQVRSILTDMIEAEASRPMLDELINNKVYQKNRYKFYIPGLKGDVRESVDMSELLDQIDQHVDQQVATIVDEMMGRTGARKIDIDPADIAYAMTAFGIKIKDYQHPSVYKKAIAKFKKDGRPQAEIDEVQQTSDDMESAVLRELATRFYYNTIINQYSLSQMLYGDQAFYKHKEDLTKRIQVFTATGDALLTDAKYGIGPTSRIGVIKDVVKKVPKNMEGVRADSYRDDYTETDAEGYMLPEFYELVARSYGIESNTDVVLKPVYSSQNEKGIPLAVKYSSKVLTDDLVKRFPHLDTLREAMRKEGIHQAVFESAVKVGTPKVAAEFTPKGLMFNNEVGFGDAIFELDNRHLRFQLNPAKDIETSVANPSQGTSFVNTNGLNAAESHLLYELNALIMSLGDKALSRELYLSEKGTLTKSSMRALIKRIIKATEGVANGQDVNYLLSYVAPDKSRISTNLPIIQQKVLATIASIYTRATTGFRFAGSKMVLQSEFGTYSAQAEELQYKDSEGYTEVLLPSGYKKYFEIGDKLGMGKNSMVGFRIPSTNYHSMLAMKVKGFYDTPVGAEANVIIAPSLIVYYHGSDYDVDTLFIIKKKAHQGEDINLNSMLTKYGLATSYNEALEIKKGAYYGYKEGKADNLDGQTLHDFLTDKVTDLEREIRYARARSLKISNSAEKAVELNKLNEMEKDYFTLIDIAKESAKNAIVDLFSTNIADVKNRTDLLTPITFSRVSSSKAETISKFYDDLATDEDLLKDLVEAGIISIQC